MEMVYLRSARKHRSHSSPSDRVISSRGRTPAEGRLHKKGHLLGGHSRGGTRTRDPGIMSSDALGEKAFPAGRGAGNGFLPSEVFGHISTGPPSRSSATLHCAVPAPDGSH